MFNIVLFEPQIAPNTGNIIRLAANNGCRLHLIKPLGFAMDEKRLRRAGLDYHEFAAIQIHENFLACQSALAGHTFYACTTKGKTLYTEANFNEGDVLLFGAETHGLSSEVMSAVKQWITIPMLPNSRSLNLANSVAIISYEAWRQRQFSGCLVKGSSS